MSYVKRLIPYILPHRKSMAVALLCTALSGVLSGVFLWLFEQVLRPILDTDAPDRYWRLNVFMGTVLVWAVARGFVDFGREYYVRRVWQRILTKLRFDLFAHFQKLSIGFFEKRRTGELMSRITNDMGALQGIMTNALITAVRSPIEVAASIGYMFFKSWQLSLLLFVVLPPMAFLIQRAGNRIRKATKQLQVQTADVTHYLQEKIAAMRLVQTFGMAEHEVDKFSDLNQESYRRSMVPVRISSSLGPMIDFVAYVGVVLVLYAGVRMAMAAEELLVFLFAMHRAAMQLKSIASLNNTLKSGEAAAERLFEIVDTQPEIVDAPDAIDLRERKVKGHLVFDNVRFAYGKGPDVLHGISFEVKPGEVVALAGLSGSGKTTISSLVPRLYDPKEGRVLLDGIDLRDVQLLSLRAHIGAVPQETTLFHGTIRDNIAYGRPDATLDEIVEAARRANADGFIRKLPKGYETHIGERGGRLSGGQRQRLAIARALLRDPRILILDEATSSLDAESERLVQDALGVLMEGRTTLIIAHRFATIWRANTILVLEEGRVVEEGTHHELLDKRGQYFRLYQMQAFIDRQHEEKESDESAHDGELTDEDGDLVEDEYSALAKPA